MNNEKKAPVRQIKFRGIIKEGKDATGLPKNWVSGFLFVTTNNTVYEKGLVPCIQVIESDTYYRSYEVIPETVGQFTGLLDKNGKEIFEGDILYHDVQGKRVVYYPFAKDVASFGLHHIEKGFKSTLQDASVLYEVISNIHEESDINSIEGKEADS